MTDVTWGTTVQTRGPILAVLLALVAASCAGGTGGTAVDAPGDPGAPTGSWVLTEARPDGPLVEGVSVTLTVEDGAVTGSTACNQVSGDVVWDDEGSWSIGVLAATEMGCEQPLMDAERAYLDALAAVDGWRLDGDELVLEGGDTLLRYGPADAATGAESDAGSPDATESPDEICESAIAMPEDGDGAPTREAALDEFISGESGWWDPPPGFTLDGTTIVYDGEPVGEVHLFQFTNGTWTVSGYEVCYPAGTAPDA